MVVNELRGEKIDVVPWSENQGEFVANALQPAKVKEVRTDADSGTALVIVPDYQLSLAIGKEGQNARLAARLTGWRIDIKSETQFAEEQRAAAAPAAVPAPEPETEPVADAAPAAAPEPEEATSEPAAEAETEPAPEPETEPAPEPEAEPVVEVPVEAAAEGEAQASDV